MNKIAQSGSIHDFEEIPPEIRKVFATAHDVSPEWHIRMQAAFQKYTDNAVSKTVNLPRDATVEDVKKIYDLAYDLMCKGVTIYRDGSKENQVAGLQPERRFPHPFPAGREGTAGNLRGIHHPHENRDGPSLCYGD